MRGIILLCLFGLAMAARLDGYHYRQPELLDFSLGAPNFLLRATVGPDATHTNLIGKLEGMSPEQSNTLSDLAGASTDEINMDPGISTGAHADAHTVTGSAIATTTATGSVYLQNRYDHPPMMGDFEKHFYTFSAPEEEFMDDSATHRIAKSVKRNLRVIFIKSPENQALENAVVQLAKHASQDRTAIYVLNKQVDFGELAGNLEGVRASNAQRPEVHFVKYRTQEDATRAQQTIQAQYDALEGQTRVSNEGVAPVIDFASTTQQNSLAALQKQTDKEVQDFERASLKNGGSTGKAYLPPSALRHKQ